MHKFDTPSPVSAVLDITAGRVRFIAADRADTTVEVRPADAANGRDVKLAEQATVEYGDGVLRIEAKDQNRVLGRTGSVEVTVQLPVGSRVEAKAVSAEFRTVGRLGDVAFDSTQASIKVDEAASARLATVDGDVSVGRLGGAVAGPLDGASQISTARGDIRIAEACRGKVVLRSQDGSIWVKAAAGVSASLDAGTSLGRIRNSLKNSEGAADLTIHATTIRGDIDADSL